jgi:hypothetical protein
MNKFLYIILLLLLPTVANSAIIMQDDFDTCTTGCSVAAGQFPSVSSPNTIDWWGWSVDHLSGTYGGVTKPSGEITSPGRGGTGKSLKLWRAGTNFKGSASYSGAIYTIPPGVHSDFYMRFYARIPAAMHIPDDTKMFRINDGDDEIYVNFMGGGSSTYLRVWGGTGDSSSNTTLLNSSQLAPALDGNWHCWQFRFNRSTGTVTIWIDGGTGVSLTDSRMQQPAWGTTSGNAYFQHFPLGNSQGEDWQSSWQAFEVDDLVFATTKAETDPDGGTTPDTEPPTRSAGSPTGALAAGTTSTTMSLTTNESATCKYGTTSAAYASLPNTFAGSGTTSHSATISGLTNGGSYTYYVRCQDDESTPNVNTDDYTISWTVSTPGAAGTLIWEEGFDNTSLAARSWDDDVTNVWVDSSQSQAGGDSFRHTWNNNAENVRNATNTANLVGVRKVIGNEDEIYVEWYWRLNSDYVGSGETYHPHLIYIIDSLWSNLSSGTLGAYLELTGRELRAVVRQGAGAADWHDSGYELPLNQWVKLGAYMKMNTVGQTDGIMRLYADGTQVYSDTAVSYRTSSSVYFNTIAIAPWISTGVGGSPQAQTMWMDELKIYDGYTESSPTTGMAIGAGTMAIGAGTMSISTQ